MAPVLVILFLSYMNIFFSVLFTGFSQTLNNANACKGGNTTQGIPCKKPVLSLLGIAVLTNSKILQMRFYLIPFLFLFFAHHSQKHFLTSSSAIFV